MRGSGGILPAGAVALFAAAVLVPALAALVTGLGPIEDGEITPARPLLELAGRSAGYAAVVSSLAVLLGWMPGRLLGRAVGGRWFVPLAAAALVPICVPGYIVFYTWWQTWPPDSALFAWAVRHDLVPVARSVTLVVALACWSWPIVAWCVAGSAASAGRGQADLLALDGAAWTARFRAAVATDGRGLAIGAFIVFIVVLGDTTSFDLAQVFTFGNELRALDAMGGSAARVLSAATPITAVAIGGGIAAWGLLGAGDPPVAGGEGPRRPAVIAAAVAGLVWAVTVLLPTGLLLAGLARLAGGRGAETGQVEQFVRFHGGALVSTLGWSAVVAGLGVVVAVGLAFMWLDHRRGVRLAAHAIAAGWLTAALVPATVLGLGLEAAYNTALPVLPGDGRTVASLVYRTPAVLVLGLLARTGFVGALLGRWIAAREPAARRDLRRLDDAGTLTGLLVTSGSRVAAAATAVFAVVLVLAMGEIPVTARVQPPGTEVLATPLLNAMHFQRPLTVLLAAVGLLAAAAVAAVILAAVFGAAARRRALVAVVILAACVPPGCGGESDERGAPLRVQRAFGTTGTAPGQFTYPRCIDADPTGEFVYVVDKTARVQRLGVDGRPDRFWPMPAKENGKPTGVSVAADGRVFVADTHYHRVIAFTPEGREVLRFGEYGEGPGEFIYPTDVAFGPEGRLYVAEYGGHDRIQVFTADGGYLFEFGHFGTEPGAFNRPQSILFDAAGHELFVADSCNHRIQVFAPDGTLLRHFGRPGFGSGELHYPYGLAWLADGTLMVCEFGNGRLQRFTTAGAPRERFGRGGAGEGELRYPWGVASTADEILVLDSGNNRVLVIRAP